LTRRLQAQYGGSAGTAIIPASGNRVMIRR
jgi:hypothetical protein